MEIKSVSKQKLDVFAKKHWQQFNRERGYIYYEKKPKYFAAFDKNKIMGYAKCQIVSGICKLSELLVAKEARGKGVGKELYLKVEGYARKNKCKKIVLKTTSKHKEACSFYRHMGFKVDAVLKGYYADLDWFCMSKVILWKEK